MKISPLKLMSEEYPVVFYGFVIMMTILLIVMITKIILANYGATREVSQKMTETMSLGCLFTFITAIIAGILFLFF